MPLPTEASQPRPTEASQPQWRAEGGCGGARALGIQVVVLLQLEGQTKESVRRDKRSSPGYCVAICFYCMAQRHLLVGASQSTVCLYCVKQLLAYFHKHLLAYFHKHLLAYFRKHLLAYFLKQLPGVCAPSLPRAGKEKRLGKGLVGAIEVVQTSECSIVLGLNVYIHYFSIYKCEVF